MKAFSILVAGLLIASGAVNALGGTWTIYEPWNDELIQADDDIDGQGNAGDNVEYEIVVKVSGIEKQSASGVADNAVWADFLDAPNGGWTNSATERSGTFEIYDEDKLFKLASQDLRFVAGGGGA